jgi:hypothetical protein
MGKTIIGKLEEGLRAGKLIGIYKYNFKRSICGAGKGSHCPQNPLCSPPLPLEEALPHHCYYALFI